MYICCAHVRIRTGRAMPGWLNCSSLAGIMAALFSTPFAAGSIPDSWTALFGNYVHLQKVTPHRHISMAHSDYICSPIARLYASILEELTTVLTSILKLKILGHKHRRSFAGPFDSIRI